MGVVLLFIREGFMNECNKLRKSKKIADKNGKYGELPRELLPGGRDTPSHPSVGTGMYLTNNC